LGQWGQRGKKHLLSIVDIVARVNNNPWEQTRSILTVSEGAWVWARGERQRITQWKGNKRNASWFGGKSPTT